MLKIEIWIRGQLDREWADWFEDILITHTADGNTLLTGTVADQSALYGLLQRLSGLGLELISVSSAGTDTGGSRR
jgi:hypothetical protein